MFNNVSVAIIYILITSFTTVINVPCCCLKPAAWDISDYVYVFVYLWNLCPE